MMLFRVLAIVLLTPAFGPVGESLAANDVGGGPDPELASSFVESAGKRGSKLPHPKDLDIILQRPLFFEGRSAKPDENLPVSTGTLPLSLKGIIVLDDQKRAIFSQADENRTIQMTLGMSHNGWSLVRILENHVDLQRGPERVRLSLNFKSPTRPTRAPGGNLELEQVEPREQTKDGTDPIGANSSDSTDDGVDHDLMGADEGLSAHQ
jgi:hypothetical protein